MFAKISEFLFGGTRGFNEAENRLLLFLQEALPASDREILSRQLMSIRKVQRPQPTRMVVAYYKNVADVPQLPYPGYEHCLGNVTYTTLGKSRTTSIVLHDGRFMSFERNIPQRLSDIEALTKVVLHPKGFSSVAGEIDAQEHEAAP